MTEEKEKAVETSKMNLHQKILAVSTMVWNVEKNINVPTGKGSYKAVSDYDVTLKVKEAEAKYGVLSVPYMQEIIHSDVLTNIDNYGNQKLTYVVDIKMTTRIVDVDKPEDYIEITSFGKGMDTGDKGYGKASTYARKYALLNVYKIATGDDPDTEASPENGTQGTTAGKKGGNQQVNRQGAQFPNALVQPQILPLMAAINEVNAAGSMDELKAVVGKHKAQFGKVKDFTTAVNNIYSKFSTNENQG